MKRTHPAIAACFAFCALIGASTLEAAIFGTDVPGDGVSVCSLYPTCNSNFIGSVSSAPGGLVSGTLVKGGSTLGLQLGTQPEFITFGGGTEGLSGFNFVGPLGFNTQYMSIAGNNVGMPISGQQITLNVTNTSLVPLSAVAFYLEIPQSLITSGFTPQPDGITFGLFCSNLVTSCTPPPLGLLSTPTGPAGSTLNAADLNPTTSTFGDLLRFSNVNLVPGATGTFGFFISDYKGTRAPNTNGSPASPSFNLEVVPTAAVPEPGSLWLGAAGLALLLARKAVRRRS